VSDGGDHNFLIVAACLVALAGWIVLVLATYPW